MKYIKKFESAFAYNMEQLNKLSDAEKNTYFNEYSFKLGDYVKFIPENYSKDILVISGVNIKTYGNKQNYYVTSLNKNLDIAMWTTDDVLRFVPKYEADAEKYNL